MNRNKILLQWLAVLAERDRHDRRAALPRLTVDCRLPSAVRDDQQALAVENNLRRVRQPQPFDQVGILNTVVAKANGQHPSGRSPVVDPEVSATATRQPIDTAQHRSVRWLR